MIAGLRGGVWLRSESMRCAITGSPLRWLDNTHADGEHA